MKANGYGKRSMLVLLGVGFAALWPPPAGATTRIGETFDPGTSDCNSFTILQSISPGGQYAAPTAGVITSWSYQADGSPAQLRLKVARPQGGDDFTVIGESPLKTPAPNQLNTYTDVQIPVQPGDVIGAYYASSGNCASMVFDDYKFHRFNADVPPGTRETFDFTGVMAKFDISAILEPDCDTDGFGDETQDADTSSCNPLPEPLAGRTLTLDANKNKVTRGKKVRLSGQVNQLARQGQCESNQPVQLQRKRPSQATFTTVEQLQTDATGSFSTRKKVKKTFEYRAQMAEAGGCASGLSNTEKVKVKKKK